MSARHRPRPAATGGYDAQGYCLKHPMVRMCRPSTSSSSSKRHAPSSGTESTADSSGEWIVSACPLCEERGSIYDEPRRDRRGDRDGRGRHEGSSHRSDRRERDRDGRRDRDRFSDRPPADIDANHGDERPTWKEARRPQGSSFRQLQQRKYEAMEFNRKSGLAGKGRSVPNRHPDRWSADGRNGRDRDGDGDGRRDRDDRALSRGRHPPPRSASARRPEIAEEYGERRRRSESRTRAPESRARSSSRGYADTRRGDDRGGPRSSSRRLDDDDRERFSRSPARERSSHRGEGRGSSRRLDDDDRGRISRSPDGKSRERSKPSGKDKKDRAGRSSKDPSKREKGRGRSQSVSSIRKGAKGAFNKLLAGASQDGQRNIVKKKKKKKSSSSDDDESAASSDDEESAACSDSDEEEHSSSDDDTDNDSTDDEDERAKNGTKGGSLAARLRQGLEKMEILAKPPRAEEDEEENESDSEEENDSMDASDTSADEEEDASQQSESDDDDDDEVRPRGGGRDMSGHRHRRRPDRGESRSRGMDVNEPERSSRRSSRGAPSARRPSDHRPSSRDGYGSSRRLDDDDWGRTGRERSSVSARCPGDSSRPLGRDGYGGSRRSSRDPSNRRPMHRADGHNRGRSHSMSSRRNDDRHRSLSRGVSAGSGHPRERPRGEPPKEQHREPRRRREPEPIGTHRRPLRGFEGPAVVVGGSGASVVSGITSPAFSRHHEKGGEDVPARPGPRLHRSHSRGSSRGRLPSEAVREGRRRSLAADDDDDCEVGGSLRGGADCPTNDIPGTIVDGTTEDGPCQDVELNPQRVGGGVSDAELNPQRVGGDVAAGAPEPRQPEKPKVKGDEKDLRQLIEWASAELAEQRRQRGLDAHSASVQGHLTYHGGASHNGSMLVGASQNWASASVQGHLPHQGGASHSVGQGQLASSFQGELPGGPLPQTSAVGGGQVMSDAEPRAAGVVAVMNGAVVDYERARREAIERLQASQRGAIDP